MRTGRPKKPLVLTVEEHEKLQEWARRPKTAQRLALRARIVLGCAEGLSNQAVARQWRVSTHTVGKWRERFRTTRLEGLADEPRPGAPREISDAQVEAVITRTLESTATRGDALEHPLDGPSDEVVAHGRGADLASLRSRAPSHQDL